MENVIEEAVKAVEELPAEVKQEVEKAVEKTEQTLTAEEKLALRELELAFLKLQTQAKAVQDELASTQKAYQTKVETLMKQYELDIKTFVFDGMHLIFRKSPAAPAQK